jgi:signal transduction histidine kinase
MLSGLFMKSPTHSWFCRGTVLKQASQSFTKFATKSERSTGLGLFLAKNIVEAHGGKVWAENNKDGKGATFTFTLPLIN